MKKLFLLLILIVSNVSAQELPELIEVRKAIDYAFQKQYQKDYPYIEVDRGNLIQQLNRFNRGPAGIVGFQPLIAVLPQGIMMPLGAVVSGDRRYVRIGLSPFFSTIGEVRTFNFGR